MSDRIEKRIEEKLEQALDQDLSGEQLEDLANQVTTIRKLADPEFLGGE